VKLRFGIPLMVALLVLTSWISTPTFNVSYVMVGLTALWAAVDSRRIRIDQYDSAMAMPPVGIAALFILGWPVAFPWYLRVRYRIAKGLVGPRQPRSNVAGYVILGVMGAVFAVAFWVLRSPGGSIQQLAALATDVSQEYGVGVNTRVTNGRTLEVTLVNAQGVVDTSRREEWMRQVAIFARERYARRDSIDSIAVRVSDVSQRGAVTMTQSSPSLAWALSQLGDTGSVRPQDDSLARSFLENVRTKNPAGAEQIQPSSDINAATWDKVSPFEKWLPQRRSDIKLIHWDFLSDRTGPSRKLTYSVSDSTDSARVQLWLVDQGGKSYVNTFRIARSTRIANR
jgi:hypothetical protein